jgi:hypothetical protein
MSNVNVVLSEQDLADFLDSNEEYMEAYRSELQRRLAEYYGSVSVEIDANALTDKFDLPDDDDRSEVDHIMNLMVNDWSWLPDMERD